VFGKKQTLERRRIEFLHRSIAVGLGLMIVTGAFLYADSAVAFLTSTTFIVKMVAVAALIFNTAAISILSPIASERSFGSLTTRERMPLMISGGVSLAGWITAIVCGIILA